MGFALPRMEHTMPSGPVELPVARSRWLHVVTHLDPKYGGLSSAVPALGQALSERTNCRAEIAAFCVEGEHFQPRGLAQSALSYWPQGRGSWLHNQRLKSSFEQRIAGVDGVHIHGLWEQSTLEACRAASVAGKPYVLSAHGMLERWALRNKRWKKLLYAALTERSNVRGAACRLALTEAEAGDYQRFGSAGPVAIIPNGVSLPGQRDPESFLAEFPELRGQRLILFLGRLHPKKGVDLLLRAWTEVAPRHREAHLVVAGPDSDGTRALLEGMVAEHSLQGQVTFTGMLNDQKKWSALAAAEAFTLPSHSEGLSMSVLEAMGMGLPVIVTRQCNLPEVKQYGAGWTIEPDYKQLIQALDELLESRSEVNREMGLAGSRLVEQRYNWAAVARQTAEVYRWVLGGPVPRHVEGSFR